MEEGDKVVVIDNCGGQSGNGSSGGKDALPPKPLAAVYHRCLSTERSLSAASCKKSLARHPSLVNTRALELSAEGLSVNDREELFVPNLRSGAWADIGDRSAMEDVFVRADDFVNQYGLKNLIQGPNAFYGVFDGHGGKHAADFACHHLPRFIAEDDDFPKEIERAISSAFLHTDTAFAEACTLDDDLASGTTALAALVIGRLEFM